VTGEIEVRDPDHHLVDITGDATADRIQGHRREIIAPVNTHQGIIGGIGVGQDHLVAANIGEETTAETTIEEIAIIITNRVDEMIIVVEFEIIN
jgi:hypothetical protein